AGQKSCVPPFPDAQTRAASGRRTMTLRYAVQRPRTTAGPPRREPDAGSGRAAASAATLDPCHHARVRVEELLLELRPAPEPADREQLRPRRILELLRHRGEDRAIPL